MGMMNKLYLCVISTISQTWPMLKVILIVAVITKVWLLWYQRMKPYKSAVCFWVLFGYFCTVTLYKQIPSGVRKFTATLIFTGGCMLGFNSLDATRLSKTELPIDELAIILLTVIIIPYLVFSFWLACVSNRTNNQKNTLRQSKTLLVFKAFIKTSVLGAYILVVGFVIVLLYCLVGVEFVQSCIPREVSIDLPAGYVNKANLDTAVEVLKITGADNTLVAKTSLTPDEQQWFDYLNTFVKQGFNIIVNYLNKIIDYIDPFIQLWTKNIYNPIIDVICFFFTPIYFSFLRMYLVYIQYGGYFVLWTIFNATPLVQFSVIFITIFSVYSRIQSLYDSTCVEDIARSVDELYKSNYYDRNQKYRYILKNRIHALEKARKADQEKDR